MTTVTSWHFPHDFGGVLVPAQALEPGVPQFPVRGPLAEADLGDKLGLDPVHVGSGQAADGLEGRVRPLEGGQGLVQAGQRTPVEAGTNLAGVVQLAVAAVVAEQQRAEPDPGPLRVGVAADGELLAVQALELQPVPGAAGPVGRVGALGDEPLPAQAARFGVIRLAVTVPVLGEMYTGTSASSAGPGSRTPSRRCSREKLV